MDELCSEIQRENKTLIFATHDTELTLKYADRGSSYCATVKIIFDGAPYTAFNDPELLTQASFVNIGVDNRKKIC